MEDLAGLAGDPFLGGGLALVEEGPGSLPAILNHVDEVDDDRGGDVAGGGLRCDGLDLRVVAIDEDDPFALVSRVAAVGLAEGGGDDSGDVVGDRAVSHLPLACGSRGFCLPFGLAGLRFLLLALLRRGADDVSRVRGTGAAS